MSKGGRNVSQTSLVFIYYHLHICWIICFIQFFILSFPYWLWRRVIPYTLYLMSSNGAWRVWPVSRGCLLLRGTWSYLRICQRSVIPYTWFCNFLLDYDSVLHIVNFAFLYWICNCFLLYSTVTSNAVTSVIDTYVTSQYSSTHGERDRVEFHHVVTF
jgi:hypothetical protein